MPEDRAARVGSHLTRLRAIRTLARMPARPVRGLRLAAVACALAAALAGAAAAAGPIPTPIGAGARYHPAAGTVPVAGLRCTSAEVPRFGVHLELFADRRVVIVPAGIGIAPPQRRQGAYVLGGRCSYPLRTREPTGVVEVERGATADARDAVPGVGAAAVEEPPRGLRLAVADPRVRRRAPLRGRPARDPAPPARRDRARARRVRRRPIRPSCSPEGARDGEGASRRPGRAGAVSRAGCGGSSRLERDHRRRRRAPTSSSGFQPRGAGRAREAGTVVSFTITQPDGTPLTDFKTRPGPAHGRPPDHRPARPRLHHPRAPADRRRRADPPGRRPAGAGPLPGRVDVYPASTPTGQHELPALRQDHRERRLPPEAAAAASRQDVTVDGYRFTLHGARRLKAIQPALVTIDRHATRTGSRPTFTPWYGALAHAIFFRKGSLDYFHTHVCAPGAVGCTSVLGPTKVTGTLDDAGQAHGRRPRPGRRDLAAVPPVPGRTGKVLTAPFTLQVALRRCGRDSRSGSPSSRSSCSRRARSSTRSRRSPLARGARARQVGPGRGCSLVAGIALAAARSRPARRCSGSRRSRVRERLPARGPSVGRARRGCARRCSRRARSGSSASTLVRVRDARVDDPLARGARLARAPLPASGRSTATRSRSWLALSLVAVALVTARSSTSSPGLGGCSPSSRRMLRGGRCAGARGVAAMPRRPRRGGPLLAPRRARRPVVSDPSPAARPRNPPSTKEIHEMNRHLTRRRARRRRSLAAAASALVVAAARSAHARVSPPVSLSKTLQLFSLAVPTEKENATTTKIVLTVAAAASRSTRSSRAPGWHRVVAADGLRRQRGDPEGDLDRRQRADRRGLASSGSSPRPRLERDLHLQRPADLLRRHDRRLERLRESRTRRRRRSRRRLARRRRTRHAHDRRARPRRGRRRARRSSRSSPAAAGKRLA